MKIKRKEENSNRFHIKKEKSRQIRTGQRMFKQLTGRKTLQKQLFRKQPLWKQAPSNRTIFQQETREKRRNFEKRKVPERKQTERKPFVSQKKGQTFQKQNAGIRAETAAFDQKRKRKRTRPVDRSQEPDLSEWLASSVIKASYQQKEKEEETAETGETPTFCYLRYPPGKTANAGKWLYERKRLWHQKEGRYQSTGRHTKKEIPASEEQANSILAGQKKQEQTRNPVQKQIETSSAHPSKSIQESKQRSGNITTKKRAKNATKNTTKSTTKNIGAKAAAETTRMTTKRITKETGKAAVETAVSAGTTAGSAGAGAGGIFLGAAVGEAVGRELDRRDRKAFTRNRMIRLFVTKLRQEEHQDSIGKAFRDIVRFRFTLLVKRLAGYAGLFLLALFSLVALVLLPVIALIAVVYNSPFAIWFPSISSAETTQQVLSAYVAEWEEEIETELEQLEGHDRSEAVYGNATEQGIPDNYCDILAVYMVKHGNGDTATDMTEQAKRNLKQIFQDMCQYDVTSGEEAGIDEAGNPTSRTVKYVHITLKHYQQMEALYGFSAEEQELLAELMKPEHLAMLKPEGSVNGGQEIPSEQYQAIVDAISNANGKKVVEFALSKVGL